MEIFEERFVVFIDILGFREMVLHAAKEPLGNEAKRVQDALARIQEINFDESGENSQSGEPQDHRTHIFSDCIIISISLSGEKVWQVFKKLAELTVDLMMLGVWIRGGMSVGKVSKNHKTPWGPAIVEAYAIESEIAIYPRLALSKSALSFIDSTMGPKRELGLIARGTDGVWALVPITWALKKHSGLPPYLTRGKAEEIKKKLGYAYEEATVNPRVYQKINWIRRDWNKLIQSIYVECQVSRGN